jgi:hypothetical protein
VDDYDDNDDDADNKNPPCIILDEAKYDDDSEENYSTGVHENEITGVQENGKKGDDANNAIIALESDDEMSSIETNDDQSGKDTP